MAAKNGSKPAGTPADAWPHIERAIGALHTVHKLAVDAINTSDSRKRGVLLDAIVDVSRLHGAELDRAYARLFNTPGVGCFREEQGEAAMANVFGADD